jgi:hypothetical protein
LCSMRYTYFWMEHKILLRILFYQQNSVRIQSEFTPANMVYCYSKTPTTFILKQSDLNRDLFNESTDHIKWIAESSVVYCNSAWELELWYTKNILSKILITLTLQIYHIRIQDLWATSRKQKAGFAKKQISLFFIL